ncbi:hypothetical protein XI08_19070 [Bradyrhizobium sp. CCBAU 11361]|nr:hypothetical protein [Bradyrhizobium sp. CCBAU 11361]
MARLSAKVSSACSATARLGAIEILHGLLLAAPNQLGISLSTLTALLLPALVFALRLVIQAQDH